MYQEQIRQIMLKAALADDMLYYHSLRVGCLMDQFASTEEGRKCVKQAWVTRNEFVIAGILHDIGKSLWPREVLLSSVLIKNMDDDMLIKFSKCRVEHPITTQKMLMDLFQQTGNRFWHRIAFGVGAHHEDYDGRGYPRNLKGSEIPLLGRILRVFNDYESKTNLRRYRSPMKADVVIEDMRRKCGQIYDPYWGEQILYFLENVSNLPDLDDWFEETLQRMG